MKIKRFLTALMCLTLTVVLHAQVIEFYDNRYTDSENKVQRAYMIDLDSLCYIPAQDWNTSLSEKEYYRDKDSLLHVVLTVTTGPNADRAFLCVSTTRPADYELVSGTVQGTVTLRPGETRDYDIALPGPLEAGCAYLCAANRIYTQKEQNSNGDLVYRDLNVRQLQLDERSWMEEREYTPWCTNAKDFKDAGGTVDWPLGEAGTGTYTFTQFIFGDLNNIEVAFRQNLVTDACQFRFLGIDKTGSFTNMHEVILPAQWIESRKVWALRFPCTDTGYEHSTYPGDPVMCADYVSYMESLGLTVPEDWGTINPDYQSCYDPAEGKFYLSMVYYISVGVFGHGFEYLQMDGFYIPDYNVSLTYRGVITGNNGSTAAVVDAELAADAKDVRAVVMPQDADADAIARTMAHDTTGFWTPLQNGFCEIPFKTDTLTTEKLQVIAAVIVKGKVKYMTTVPFEYYNGESPWQSIGTGLYTDDLITTMYISNTEAPTYEVEVMEHKDHPGLYRVMNPYTEDVYPFGKAMVENWHSVMAPEGSYLEINAEDPNGAYIPRQGLQCIIDEQNGEPSYCTVGAYTIENGQQTFEEAKQGGYLGTVTEGVIRFPYFKQSSDREDIFQGYMWLGSEGPYYGATTKGVSLVLPDAVQYEQTLARARANQTKRELARRNTEKLRMPKVHEQLHILKPHPINKQNNIAPHPSKTERIEVHSFVSRTQKPDAEVLR